MAETLLSIVNRVRRNVGLDANITSFSDDDESNDNVQDVAEAYEELISFLPPRTPYLNQSASITTSASTRLYSLANGANSFDLYEYSFENETESDAPLRFVSKEYVQQIDNRWDEVEGKPYLFYLEGNNQVGFYPVPDGTYTINYQYGRALTTLPSATSDTFIVPDVWMRRFVAKRAQEKYERRKGYGDPDASAYDAINAMTEIIVDATDMEQPFLLPGDY